MIKRCERSAVGVSLRASYVYSCVRGVVNKESIPALTDLNEALCSFGISDLNPTQYEKRP